MKVKSKLLYSEIARIEEGKSSADHKDISSGKKFPVTGGEVGDPSLFPY